MINEAQKYPTDKEKFDMNYLKAMGYCNAHNCPNNWACYRYVERTSKNNVSYVPRPKDYNNCEFYAPAKCAVCNGRGWNQDYDRTQRKNLKTDCLICGGVGLLDYHNFKKGNSKDDE